MKKIHLTLQKGVTILELILYMAILSSLLVILTSIFVAALDVQMESAATSSVEEDGNYILAKLTYDIHRAQSINTPSINGETSTGSFEIVIDGTAYTYATDVNNNLILTNNTGANNLNNYNSGISNFLVMRLGNAGGVEDALVISFVITSKERRISGYETRNFSTNLSLRRQ